MIEYIFYCIFQRKLTNAIVLLVVHDSAEGTSIDGFNKLIPYILYTSEVYDIVK